MDSDGRLIFDSSVVGAPHRGGGQMLLFGGGGSIFRGSARSMLGIEERGQPKRPFFTTHDELLEEEYYDEQLPEKKRRLTPEQVLMLERSFEAENKLEPERKSELAKQLGLAPRQVAVWFQNRRARCKTKQLEQDFDRLKSSYDSALADHDSLLKDNHRLRSLVISLTEKLQAKDSSTGSMVADASFGLDHDEQIAASVPTAVAIATVLKAEDRLSADTNGSVVRDTKACLTAEEGYYVDPPPDGCMQSEEEVGDGGVSDEGCSFFPDDDQAMLLAVADPVEQQNHHHHHLGGQDENHLDNWWFWN